MFSSLAFIPMHNIDMQKINLGYFHEFARGVGWLQLVEPDISIDDTLCTVLNRVHALLYDRMTNQLVPLSTSKQVTAELIQAITGITSRQGNGEKTNEQDAQAVSAALQKFETVFLAELSLLDAYFVSQKGLYSTNSLIEQADVSIPDTIRKQMSQETVKEIKQAGRCLAFELPTASAFHILRAVESVMQDYFKELVGSLPIKQIRNWGAFIKNLQSNSANPKIIANLEQIKDNYRNPIVHPDAVVEMEDAMSLFSLCQSALILITKEIQDLKAAKTATP